MDEVQKLLDFFLKLLEKYGIVAILIVALLLFIQDPDRITKIKSIVFKFLFRCFRIGKRTYISSNITYRLNSFFNDNKLNKIFSSSNLRFSIKWVKKATDPILTKNGTLIINLESSSDQTKNILKATQLTLPLIVCPSLRQSLNQDSQDAIDLTLLKKMTEQIGKYAYPVFEKYFLNPNTEGKQEIVELYSMLIKIDTFGLFVPIFIEELNILSSNFFAEVISENLTEDIKDFIVYLLSIANRDIGEEIELNYIRKYFKIGFVLVAKKQKSETEGARPYIDRASQKIKLGCEKVYLIGFSNNSSFFHDVQLLLKNDNRYTVSDIIKSHSIGKYKIKENLELFSIVKNSENSDSRFTELISFNNITIGNDIKCSTLDVLNDVAIFDVYGLSGFVYSKYCSWSKRSTCLAVFKKNTDYELTVIGIDYDSEKIILSNKKTIDNPVLKTNSPKEGDIVSVEFIDERMTYFICITEQGFEIVVPKNELSWSCFVDYSKFIGVKSDVIIYKILIDEGTIIASIKRNLNNPWTNINSIYPRGSVVTAEVHHVNEYGVYFILPNGLFGFMNNEHIIQAPSDVKILRGIRLSVIIDRVLASKNKIYLSFPK